MFETLKKQSVERLIKDALQRESEERLYAQVVQEIEAGQRRDGLWAKALTLSSGDENRAKAEYIKLRVQSLLDDQMLHALREVDKQQKEQAAKKQERERAEAAKASDAKKRAEENRRKEAEAKAKEAEKRKRQRSDPVRNDWGNIT